MQYDYFLKHETDCFTHMSTVLTLDYALSANTQNPLTKPVNFFIHNNTSVPQKNVFGYNGKSEPTDEAFRSKVKCEYTSVWIYYYLRGTDATGYSHSFSCNLELMRFVFIPNLVGIHNKHLIFSICE